ncbi:Uncharacterized protein MSYG_0628 [Malassezia sympodialis ATCC 42132]|uniref:Altered inheritance of mitochondria protein 41 n=1 Tax=Malassezia sympodialis (strain ATCC 42132) TaxID=1230383 RepID=A0A1M8A1E2_MALS4|nr:Uncharacterized protein MSYG_0628 [Malassezia sympodialis ATCC 42132]
MNPMVGSRQGLTRPTFIMLALVVPRVSRRAFHLGRVLAKEVQSRAPNGPNPLDEPTLALVKQHWKQARLAKDSDRATLLGGILTDLQYAQKTKAQPNQKPPSIIKMLQKGIKKRTDAAKVFRNAKPEPRVDLAEKEEREIAILQEFLPK